MSVRSGTLVYTLIPAKVSEYQSSGYQSFRLLVPCGLAGLSPFGPRVPCGLAELKSFWSPRYPEDWRDAALLAPSYTGLAGLSPFSHQVHCGLPGLSTFSPHVP